MNCSPEEHVRALRSWPPAPWAVRALASSSAPTWVYERRVVAALEVGLLLATVAARPTLLALATGVLAIAVAMVAQTQRSIAARRRERAEALGLLGAMQVSCEEADVRRATAQHVLSGLAPVTAIVTAAHGAGVTAAVLVGAAATAIRWGCGLAYDRWRRWYRMHRPARVEA